MSKLKRNYFLFFRYLIIFVFVKPLIAQNTQSYLHHRHGVVMERQWLSKDRYKADGSEPNKFGTAYRSGFGMHCYRLGYLYDFDIHETDWGVISFMGEAGFLHHEGYFYHNIGGSISGNYIAADFKSNYGYLGFLGELKFGEKHYFSIASGLQFRGLLNTSGTWKAGGWHYVDANGNVVTSLNLPNNAKQVNFEETVSPQKSVFAKSRMSLNLEMAQQFQLTKKQVLGFGGRGCLESPAFIEGHAVWGGGLFIRFFFL